MTKRLWIVGATLVVCGSLWAALASRAADKDKATAPPDKPAVKDKADVPADSDQPTEAKSSEQADAVQDIATAYKLAEWGRRMDPQSPFALCTAAEMLHRTTLFSGLDPQYRDRITAPETTEKQDPKEALAADVEKMLDEAVKMAKTNKQDVVTVQAMAKAVREGRGGLNGPLMFTMVLRPWQTDTYNMKFKKGQWVRIAVHHPEDTPIYLQVVNNRGDKRADDLQWNPAIAFIPHEHDGEDYKVTVSNKSKRPITYQLFTN